MRFLVKRRLIKLLVLLCSSPFVIYICTRPGSYNQKYVGENRTLEISRHALTSTGFVLHHRASSNISYHKRTDAEPSTSGLYAATNFCNSPFRAVNGTEGQAPKGFRLKSVHVFINHGDSTSRGHFAGQDFEDISCKFSTWYNGFNDKFKQYPNHMKKMTGTQDKRSHFLNWALYPDREVCVGSILTSRGALQLLNLGQYLYDVYDTDVRLFDPKLSLTNQIHLKSMTTSTSYQSAIALLYGFMPVFDISRINIYHSQDPFFCNKDFTSPKSCICKHGSYLRTQIEKIQKKFERSRKRLLSFLQSSTSNILPSITAFADALTPSLCHNITRSCDKVTRSTNCDDVIGKIWNALIVQESFRKEDPDSSYIKHCSIMTTPVLMEILQRMKDALENRLTPKFVFYSGNEATMSALLCILDVHLRHTPRPPFASRLVIELYQDDNSVTNKHAVKFMYNGNDVTSDVEFCRGHIVKGLCDFNLFADFVFTKQIRRFGYRHFDEACSIHG